MHSFIAVPGAGGTMKIVPDANQRFYPGSQDLQDNVSPTSDEVVTQVIPVKNVSAVQLVTVLRPLVPTTGQINAYSPANMIIISDHAANVSRIMKIIARIDQVGDCRRGSGPDAECLGHRSRARCSPASTRDRRSRSLACNP